MKLGRAVRLFAALDALVRRALPAALAAERTLRGRHSPAEGRACMELLRSNGVLRSQRRAAWRALTGEELGDVEVVTWSGDAGDGCGE